MRLIGRRIAISGAASGIGRCTAELFAREGAQLILLDRDADGLAETARRTGGTAHSVDITDENSVVAAVDAGAFDRHIVIVSRAGMDCEGRV